MSQSVEEAVAAIRAWGEQRDWCGYDPYDGLNSPFAPVLSLGTTLGRRVVTQAVKLSPLNLRPLFGIRPALNAKAIGLVASAYARLAAAGDELARLEMVRRLSWLMEHPARGETAAWGYHFPVQTRVFRYERGSANTIATSFVAQGFLDAWELLGVAHRETLRGTVGYLTRMLAHDDAGPYFRYVGAEDELVHNANLLACAVLARAAPLLDDPSLEQLVEAATRRSLAAQRSDGSWPYAEGDGHGWVDNFHTGYVLESLATCMPLVADADAALERGLTYWTRALFLADGTPKYTPTSVYPLDAHCYAQAVETWVSLRARRDDALDNAERVARLLIADFLHPRGFVRFQRRRRWSSSVPFMRWTTAPSFRALARLLLERGR